MSKDLPSYEDFDGDKNLTSLMRRINSGNGGTISFTSIKLFPSTSSMV